MIKAVIFDYGGVIKIGCRLSTYITKISDISDEEFEQIKDKESQIAGQAAKGIISDEEYWKKFSEIIGKPLPDNCVETAQKFYRENFVFIPEIIDLAKKLKVQGIETAVLSNIFKFEAEVIIEKKGYDLFNPVILSYEVGMQKPELDIYELAIKRLNMKPEESIFIDDKETNLVPARELGIKTVLAENPEQIIKDVFSIINS